MSLVFWLPLAIATHDTGCIPTRAEPGTYIMLDLSAVGGPIYYFEERDVPAPFNTNPPIPLSGFVLGGGSWWYEETNGVFAPEGSLQRGWCFVDGGAGPECLIGNCWPDPPLPCLIINDDPINDWTCLHGPDTIVF